MRRWAQPDCLRPEGHESVIRVGRFVMEGGVNGHGRGSEGYLAGLGPQAQPIHKKQGDRNEVAARVTGIPACRPEGARAGRFEIRTQPGQGFLVRLKLAARIPGGRR